MEYGMNYQYKLKTCKMWSELSDNYHLTEYFVKIFRILLFIYFIFFAF